MFIVLNNHMENNWLFIFDQLSMSSIPTIQLYFLELVSEISVDKSGVI